MRIAVDTNVLLRMANPDDPRSPGLVATIKKLTAQGYDVGHVPQARREFWGVATRPLKVDGLGASPEIAKQMLLFIDKVIPLWDDQPGISGFWQEMVESLGVCGRQTHDANHAAAAIFHGSKWVLTFDIGDFERFVPHGLKPLDPRDCDHLPLVLSFSPP